MVTVSDKGMTKVCGKAAWVTRTWVRLSLMARSAVSRVRPGATSSKWISGLQTSRITRVIGQRSPFTSPALAARNWRPNSFWPLASRSSSCK